VLIYFVRSTSSKDLEFLNPMEMKNVASCKVLSAIKSGNYVNDTIEDRRGLLELAHLISK
jgi:hypothetical protein